jgi:hypothetical protein
VLDRDQLLRIVEGQRRKQNPVDQREYRGVRADTEGQRDHGDRRERTMSE